MYVIAPAIADSAPDPVPPLIPIEAGFEVLNSYPVVPFSIIVIIFPTTGAGRIIMWFASLSASTNTTDVPAAIVPFPEPSSVAVLATAVLWIPVAIVTAPVIEVLAASMSNPPDVELMCIPVEPLMLTALPEMSASPVASISKIPVSIFNVEAALVLDFK